MRDLFQVMPLLQCRLVPNHFRKWSGTCPLVLVSVSGATDRT